MCLWISLCITTGLGKAVFNPGVRGWLRIQFVQSKTGMPMFLVLLFLNFLDSRGAEKVLLHGHGSSPSICRAFRCFDSAHTNWGWHGLFNKAPLSVLGVRRSRSSSMWTHMQTFQCEYGTGVHNLKIKRIHFLFLIASLPDYWSSCQSPVTLSKRNYLNQVACKEKL